MDHSELKAEVFARLHILKELGYKIIYSSGLHGISGQEDVNYFVIYRYDKWKKVLKRLNTELENIDHISYEDVKEFIDEKII